jgi:catechol 2,3-dioxygenase-like lactoylglutathione lyase family enzyme
VKLVKTLAVIAALAFGGNAAAQAQQTETSSNDGAEFFTGLIIYANDVDRSVKFYTDVMGLKVAGRVEHEGQLSEILLSKSGKLLRGAVLTIQPTKGLPERTDPNRLKFGVILFMTDSNKALEDRLHATGYEVTERDALHLLTKDPDGHQIMIYQLDDRLKQSQQ